MGIFTPSGAVLYAVAAVRARDEVHAAQGRDGTVDGAALLIRQRLAGLEDAHVVLHLLERGGAGEHREHARQIEAVAIGPAGLARIRISGGEHRSTALGQIRQTSATHRLHDDDWLAVGRSHFHAARRLG